MDLMTFPCYLLILRKEYMDFYKTSSLVWII